MSLLYVANKAEIILAIKNVHNKLLWTLGN